MRAKVPELSYGQALLGLAINRMSALRETLCALPEETASACFRYFSAYAEEPGAQHAVTAYGRALMEAGAPMPRTSYLAWTTVLSTPNSACAA